MALRLNDHLFAWRAVIWTIYPAGPWPFGQCAISDLVPSTNSLSFPQPERFGCPWQGVCSAAAESVEKWRNRASGNPKKGAPVWAGEEAKLCMENIVPPSRAIAATAASATIAISKPCPKRSWQDGHFWSKNLVPPGGKFKIQKQKIDIWLLIDMGQVSKDAELYFEWDEHQNLFQV